MAAYMAITVLTGTIFASVCILGFGGGLWMAALWYILGSWAGFGLSLTASLLLGSGAEPEQSRLRAEFS